MTAMLMIPADRVTPLRSSLATVGIEWSSFAIVRFKVVWGAEYHLTLVDYTTFCIS